MSNLYIQNALKKIENGDPLTSRDRQRLLGAAPGPAGNLDFPGFVGDDLRSLCQFALAYLDRSHSLQARLLKVATGTEAKPDANEVDGLVSAIARLPGTPSDGLRAALDLGAASTWTTVAEVFKARWGEERKPVQKRVTWVQVTVNAVLRALNSGDLSTSEFGHLVEGLAVLHGTADEALVKALKLRAGSNWADAVNELRYRHREARRIAAEAKKQTALPAPDVAKKPAKRAA